MAEHSRASVRGKLSHIVYDSKRLHTTVFVLIVKFLFAATLINS